jgi:hypothetical protein
VRSESVVVLIIIIMVPGTQFDRPLSICLFPQGTAISVEVIFISLSS